MLVEALAKIGAESVIDGTAVGVVRVHVAEGHASREGRWIASVESESLRKVAACWMQGKPRGPSEE